MTTERPRPSRPSRPRRRRGHAAAGGRLLVGGLSASLLIGLVGGMVRAEHATPSTSSSFGQTVLAGPGTSTNTKASSGAQVSRTTSEPVTTTRGSS